MANLELIKSLNQRYDKKSVVRKTKLFSIMKEAFDRTQLRKGVRSAIAEMGPEYTRYFDLGLPADAVLMFVDVCGFSTRFSDYSGEEISKYFDEYYDLVIPIIYEFGGEIDKIIGDGIICLFAPPFQNETLSNNILKASSCAKKIIRVTKGTDYSSKVAFHSGSINYFKNKTDFYKEFTVVGKPMTELFRLEAVSIDETINYYDDTEIRAFFQKRFGSNQASHYSGSSTPAVAWTHYGHLIQGIKGIDYEQFFSIKYNH